MNSLCFGLLDLLIITSDSFHSLFYLVFCLILFSFLFLLTQDIVIGTPGRLKDLIEMGVCYLKEVSFVVGYITLDAVLIS